MKRVCAWCGAVLKESEKPSDENEPISHGMCRDCAFHIRASTSGVTLQALLERFDAPVVCVSDERDILTANKRALHMLGKDIELVTGLKGGTVFECKYSYLPQGCGNTEHCLGCTIRNTVMDTMKTGKSHIKEPVTLNHKTQGTLGMHVTTEKAGECVLLRID